MKVYTAYFEDFILVDGEKALSLDIVAADFWAAASIAGSRGKVKSLYCSDRQCVTNLQDVQEAVQG